MSCFVPDRHHVLHQRCAQLRRRGGEPRVQAPPALRVPHARHPGDTGLGLVTWPEYSPLIGAARDREAAAARERDSQPAPGLLRDDAGGGREGARQEVRHRARGHQERHRHVRGNTCIISAQYLLHVWVDPAVQAEPHPGDAALPVAAAPLAAAAAGLRRGAPALAPLRQGGAADRAPGNTDTALSLVTGRRNTHL